MQYQSCNINISNLILVLECLHDVCRFWSRVHLNSTNILLTDLLRGFSFMFVIWVLYFMFTEHNNYMPVATLVTIIFSQLRQRVVLMDLCICGCMKIGVIDLSVRINYLYLCTTWCISVLCPLVWTLQTIGASVEWSG